MNSNMRSWMACLIVAAIMMVGCGEGGGGAGAVSIPDTPDGTVKAVADSLAKNQPRAAWDAMPARWQTDVNGLVSDFAGKMDAEMYDTTFSLMGKLSDTLSKQKALVLAMLQDPQMQNMVPLDAAALESRYDTVVAFVGTLARNDASTLAGLKQLDIGKFLGTTGAKLMADMERLAELAPDASEFRDAKAKMAAMKVELIESSNTAATLRVSTGDITEQQAMTKIDNRWVPKAMADSWDAQIAEAKASLAEMTGEAMAESKPQVMALLKSLDAGLSTVSKAETKEELQQAVMGMVGAVMQQMMGGEM